MYAENLEPKTFIAEDTITCTQLSTDLPAIDPSDKDNNALKLTSAPAPDIMNSSDFWLG